MDNRAIKNFDANVASLEDLVHFDDKLIDLILGPLERLRGRLGELKITNERHLPNGVIKLIRNIKSNESLKTHYSALYNQWLVLLVSYFGSAIRELFVDASANAIRTRTHPIILKELLQAPVEELAEEHDDISMFLADLLASGKDVSFQDMQSIGRTFSRYFGIEQERTSAVNDIILAQACRHAIVHSGGIADRRLINQLRSATPRSLKVEVILGSNLAFTPEEIGIAAGAMQSYLRRIEVAILNSTN